MKYLSTLCLFVVTLPLVAGCNVLAKKEEGRSSTVVTSGAPIAAATPAPPAVADTPGPSAPAGEAGARQLLAEFVKPGANVAALSASLRPTAADYRALYDGETAKKLEEAYAKDWDAGRLVVGPKPGQTEVKLWSASSEDLKAGRGNARAFPNGYRRVAPHLAPGQTLVAFRFVEPGKDLGMAFDGLAHVNGHWVIVPKPWRAVKGED